MQVQNRHAFLPYGLAPNYTPPNVVHTPNENVSNSTPISIESQQPQADHAHVSQPIREAHEIPHHNLADFEPCLGYTLEGDWGSSWWCTLAKHFGGPSVSPTITTLAFCGGESLSCYGGKGKVGLDRGKDKGY